MKLEGNSYLKHRMEGFALTGGFGYNYTINQ